MILACFSQNSQEFSGSGSVFSHVSTIPKSLCIKKANILFDLVKFSNFSIRNLLKTPSLILNFVLLKYSFGNFEKRTYFADNVHCKRDGGLTKIVCSKPPILPALYIMYKTILTSTEFTYFFNCFRYLYEVDFLHSNWFRYHNIDKNKLIFQNTSNFLSFERNSIVKKPIKAKM